MVLIVLGFFLLSSAWSVLHQAQKTHQLASTGVYKKCRHPQYIAFILIMFGFLLQWPTIPTLIMFPILVVVYIRLAKFEEKQAITEFGEAYLDYTHKHQHGYQNFINSRPVFESMQFVQREKVAI